MRGIFRALSKIVIESYVWIALGAATMGLELAAIFKLAFPKDLFLLLFGGTLFTYQFHRWYKPSRLDFKSPQMIWMGLAIGIVLIGVLGIRYSTSFLFLNLSAVVSLLYIIPFRDRPLVGRAKKSFRERRGLKLWIISLTWVLTTVLLPWSWQPEISLNPLTLTLFVLERLCFIAAITIPFDIRDIYTDSTQLETYPQQYGTRKSKQLSYLLLLVGWSCLMGLFSLGVLSADMVIGISLLSLLSFLLIYKAKQGSPKWYFTVLLDGLTLLHAAVIIVSGVI